MLLGASPDSHRKYAPDGPQGSSGGGQSETQNGSSGFADKFGDGKQGRTQHPPTFHFASALAALAATQNQGNHKG